MGKIVLTRGLPASGKSTWAKEFARRNPRTVRVSRDDLRAQLFPGAEYKDIDEGIITEAETAIARAALRAGCVVVVDAMHLPQRYVNRWQRLGYPVYIANFEAPLDSLVSRNSMREDSVPLDTILSNHKKYTNKDGSLKQVTVSPEQYEINYKYLSDTTLPSAVIVDVDGTLAHNDGHRSYFDYSKVIDDKPVYHVIDAVNGLNNIHHTIVVSGRKAEAETDTREWLLSHGVLFDELHMRADNDGRTDMIVKMEILRDKIAPKYNVVAVIDDRPSVCEMWRKVGIPTFQVGDPDVRF